MLMHRKTCLIPIIILNISDSVGDDEKPKPMTAAMRQKEREEKRKKKKKKSAEKRQERLKKGTYS